MAIDPQALADFLERQPPPIYDVKGAPPEALRASIARLTGASYTPKLEPRPPQLEGLALACYVEQCLLFYGMRMGKTKIALDWAALLRKGRRWNDKGLVIAHAPVGVDVWEGQAAIHTDLIVTGIRSGPAAQDELLAALEGPADLIVMSWSTLQSLFTEKRLAARGARKGQPKLYPDYGKLRAAADCFGLIIIDEIHRCKNWTSLWFTIGAELGLRCRYRLGLTGTAINRDYMAVWAQAYLIDRGRALGSSFPFFEQAFGTKKKIWDRNRRDAYEYVFDKAKLPILLAKLAPFTLSYKLADTQTVDVMRGEVVLRMSAAQKTAYAEVLERAVEAAQSDNAEEIENTFVRRRQIASGFLPFTHDDGEAGIYEFPNNPKLAWLGELAEDLAGDVQIVIFHEFVHTGRMICDLLTKKKIKHGWLWGGSKDQGVIVRDFQAGKSRWLVANSASGSMAIDLPMADYLLFYESPTSAVTRAQAEARPLSRGAKTLLIDDLLCSPVEQRILGFIHEGKSALAVLMGANAERGLLRSKY